MGPDLQRAPLTKDQCSAHENCVTGKKVFALAGFQTWSSLAKHTSPSTAVDGVKARLWRTRVNKKEKMVSAWLIFSRWGVGYTDIMRVGSRRFGLI